MILDTVSIPDFDKLADSYGESINQAAVMAINDTVGMGHSRLKQDMMKRTTLSSSYIGDQKSGRLRVSRKATRGDLTASINARMRGTSLARFLTKTPQRGQRVSLSITPGTPRTLTGAFLMNLGSGNIGLAHRVKGNPNVHPFSKGAIKLKHKGLFLLYGPSVSQIMNQVIENNDYIQADISSQLNIRFNAHFGRLLNG